MREQSMGGAPTGNVGVRVSASNPEDPTDATSMGNSGKRLGILFRDNVVGHAIDRNTKRASVSPFSSESTKDGPGAVRCDLGKNVSTDLRDYVVSFRIDRDTVRNGSL
jgi:hypothetical protein